MIHCVLTTEELDEFQMLFQSFPAAPPFLFTSQSLNIFQDFMWCLLVNKWFLIATPIKNSTIVPLQSTLQQLENIFLIPGKDSIFFKKKKAQNEKEINFASVTHLETSDSPSVHGLHASKQIHEWTNKIPCPSLSKLLLNSLSLFKIFCYDTCVEVGKHKDQLGLDWRWRSESHHSLMYNGLWTWLQSYKTIEMQGTKVGEHKINRTNWDE